MAPPRAATVLSHAPPAARREGETTADRILDAAELLFAERGFHGTALRDVAARVGIRTPSLYNHFDGKDSLYAAVLARGIGPLLEALSEFLTAWPQAEADPRSAVGRLMEILAARPQLPRLILHETASGGERLTPMLRQWLEPVFDHAGELAARSPAAERWGAAQIPLLVLAMYHIVIGYFTIAPLYRELRGADLLSEEALARQTHFLAEVVAALFEEPGAPPLPR